MDPPNQRTGALNQVQPNRSAHLPEKVTAQARMPIEASLTSHCRATATPTARCEGPGPAEGSSHVPLAVVQGEFCSLGIVYHECKEMTRWSKRNKQIPVPSCTKTMPRGLRDKESISLLQGLGSVRTRGYDGVWQDKLWRHGHDMLTPAPQGLLFQTLAREPPLPSRNVPHTAS